MTSSATRTTTYSRTSESAISAAALSASTRKPCLQERDVLRRVIDQEVDVLREAPRAVSDDREAPDQDVAGAGLVQRPADADDVFRLRSACVRAIVRVIHASASSKVLKR